MATAMYTTLLPTVTIPAFDAQHGAEPCHVGALRATDLLPYSGQSDFGHGHQSLQERAQQAQQHCQHTGTGAADIPDDLLACTSGLSWDAPPSPLAHLTPPASPKLLRGLSPHSFQNGHAHAQAHAQAHAHTHAHAARPLHQSFSAASSSSSPLPPMPNISLPLMGDEWDAWGLTPPASPTAADHAGQGEGSAIGCGAVDDFPADFDLHSLMDVPFDCTFRPLTAAGFTPLAHLAAAPLAKHELAALPSHLTPPASPRPARKHKQRSEAQAQAQAQGELQKGAGKVAPKQAQKQTQKQKRGKRRRTSSAPTAVAATAPRASGPAKRGREKDPAEARRRQSAKTAECDTAAAALARTGGGGGGAGTAAGRKHAHNVLERKRRNDLRLGFDVLRGEIEALKTNDAAPAQEVLRHAVDLVHGLQRDERVLVASIAAAKADNARLQQLLAGVHRW